MPKEFSFFPNRSDRVVLIGPTGSGKSVLARLWLQYFNRVVTIDLKHDWKIPVKNYKIITRSTEITTRNLTKYHHLIYRPSFKTNVGSIENKKELDNVAKECLALSKEVGGIVLYYDDLAFVANESNFMVHAPNYYLAVTTGRGLGLAVWSSIQRPHRIPLISMTESERRVTFYLRARTDRKAAEEAIHDEIPWLSLRREQHSFFMSTDQLDYAKPIKLQLKGVA